MHRPYKCRGVVPCHGLSSPSDFVSLCITLDDFVTYYILLLCDLLWPLRNSPAKQLWIERAERSQRCKVWDWARVLPLLTKLLEALKPKASQASQHISIRTQFELKRFNVDSATSSHFESPWFLGAQLKPNSTPGRLHNLGFPPHIFSAHYFTKIKAEWKSPTQAYSRKLLEVQV